MQGIIELFRNKNPFESIVNSTLIANHKAVSPQLLAEIKNNPREFKRFIESKSSAVNEIEKMTLVHLILLHSSQFYDCFETLHLTTQCNDSWINQNILARYQHFLHKLILSSEQYDKIRIINLGWNGDLSPNNDYSCKTRMRESPKEYFNFQMLCYCVNMLYELFTFLSKIPTLGRYYPKTANPCYDSFVSVASYQVVLFYFCLKFIAKELLVHHKKYLISDSQQLFFKEVLSLHLEKINEQLKTLLLNKYYNPIEKGIKVGVFEIDKQTDESLQALYELSIIDKENRNRNTKKNRQFLGKKIFRKDGAFDGSTFEESLLLMSSKKYSQTDFQQLYDKENYNQLNTAGRVSRKALEESIFN